MPATSHSQADKVMMTVPACLDNDVGILEDFGEAIVALDHLGMPPLRNRFSQLEWSNNTCRPKQSTTSRLHDAFRPYLISRSYTPAHR